MAISFRASVRKIWASIIDASFTIPNTSGALKRLAVAINPTENKGDIAVNDGDEMVSVPVGADDTALVADSTASAGVSWLSIANYVKTLVRAVASTTVTNSNADTAIFTQAVDHDDINDHALRLTFGGTYTNDTAGAQTFGFSVLFGGSTVYQDITISLTRSATPRAFEGHIMLTSRSTTAQEISGRLVIGAAASSSTGNGGLDTTATLVAPIQGVGAANTSGAGTKTLQLNVQHSAADANLTLALRTAVLERV